MTRTASVSSPLLPLLSGAWREEVVQHLEPNTVLLAAFEPDLDAALHFASGIVVLAQKQLLTHQAGSDVWQSWILSPPA